MHGIDVTSRREQRNFGLVMAAAFVLIGGVRWWVKGAPSPVVFTTALVFLIAALIAPFALRPVFWAWLRFAEALNWVVTRVLLTVIFSGLITPARVLNQLFGSDPLNRAWKQERDSYWETPEDQPSDRELYRNQF